jgi:hypothetical protein
MAVTYTWSVANTERNLSDGGVTVAHWRCEAVDGDYSASSYGTVGFTPDADAADFIAYDNLTEADVIGWVQTNVGQSTVEDALAAKIEADKNPTTGAGVPW